MAYKQQTKKEIEMPLETLVIDSKETLEESLDDRSRLFFSGNIYFKIDIEWCFSVGDIHSDGDIRSDGYIHSDGYISSVGDIHSDGYIRSGGDIRSDGYIYTRCLYGIKYATKLVCEAVVPLSGPDDRKLWGDRFGIDTNTGCWDEFVERLAVAAPKLLHKKCWLPIEKLMIESSTGKYKE